MKTNVIKDLKILFLGLDGSGKSTIIVKLRDLKNEEVVEIYPTPFLDSQKINFENKIINLIEVSGQQRYRKFWQMFYEDVNGIIFVIDGSDYARVNIVKEIVEKLDKDLQRKLPVVFLINKQDIEGSLNKGEIKNYLNLDKLDSNFIWTMKNCIGFTGFGIKEAVNFILENIS